MTRIVALLGGGDWADASVCHLVVPADMDLDKENKAWNEWYTKKYCVGLRGGVRVEFISFEQQLIQNGARRTTTSEVLEYWEP